MDALSYLLGKKSGGGSTYNAKLDVTASYDVGTNTNGVTALLTNIDNLDTSNMTNGEYLFKGCLHLKRIPLLDFSKMTSLFYAFSGCSSLEEVPLLDIHNVSNLSNCFSNCSSLTSIPQLDTSKVGLMPSIFNSCSNLVDIPVLNTSQCGNMKNMVTACNKLSDTSLDNILQMCINCSPLYMQTKTLYDLGFRKTIYSQAKIQSLPHYQDFLDAGWTTGY